MEHSTTPKQASTLNGTVANNAYGALPFCLLILNENANAPYASVVGKVVDKKTITSELQWRPIIPNIERII